ncbi:MAG: glycosyltransferase [Planctomycetes bacterium]|nr:glycosyltransferase [Planctomycetota bacterium]
MNEPPMVTVVTTLFNGRRWLREALESALGQSHPAVEVVVVDDGSTDGGAELARGLGVRVISQANAGVAAARNRGIEVARGDFVVFLDQDDRLLPRAIEAHLETLRARPEVGWVVGRLRRIDAQGRPRGEEEAAPGGPLDTLSLLRGRSRCGGTPGRALFPRALLRAVGGFDARHAPADDYDLFLKVSRRAPGAWVDEVVIEYRRHDANVSNQAARTLRATLGVLAAHGVGGGLEVAAACAEGRAHWRRVFAPSLVSELRAAVRRGEGLRGFRAAAAWIGGVLAARRA